VRALSSPTKTEKTPIKAIELANINKETFLEKEDNEKDLEIFELRRVIDELNINRQDILE